MPRLTARKPRPAEVRAKIALALLGTHNAQRGSAPLLAWLGVRLPVDLKTRLQAEATRQGVKVSALAVEALERLLDSEKERQP